MQPLDPDKKPAVHTTPLNHVGLWIDDLDAAVQWMTTHGVRFAPGGIRKGAAGHDVCFIHPKGSDEFPLGGRRGADRAGAGAAGCDRRAALKRGPGSLRAGQRAAPQCAGKWLPLDEVPNAAAMTGRTLYDKIWEEHVVHTEDDGTTVLYIDRHLVHEVTSPQAFQGLDLAGRKVWRLSANLAVSDHNVPTTDRSHGIADPISRLQVETLDANCDRLGITQFKMNDKRQGIVHVIGPEQGATLPGMTVVCGDSHTSTHGAFGALAHGIGTSEVEHVLATQTLLAKKAKNMLVRVEGLLPKGCGAKDIVLAIIGRIGTAGGTGYTIEFAGRAIRALSMEGRMTVCNMAIEAGARAGLIGVDETTLGYVKGRPYSPKGAHWEQAVAHWRTLHSDADAKWDAVIELDAAQVRPQVTWGTSPEMVVSIEDCVPDPDREKDVRQTRCDGARAQVHEPRAEQGDRGHPARQGVHRLVHQLAHRRFARSGRHRAQARGPGRVEREARDGRARFGSREGAGRARGPRRGFQGGWLRMARAGLLDVPGDECRPA